MPKLSWLLTIAGSVLLSLLAGCAASPGNPSFPVAENEGRLDLSRMEEHPKALARPLVVVGGFLDPGVAAWFLHDEFSSVTGDRRIVGVSLGECLSFDDCTRKIVGDVQRRWPAAGDRETVEVDVVGVSMGGVAARYAALPDVRHRRLRIARLFTISSPLLGAELALELPPLHPLQVALRPGSPMLTRINSAPATYPIYPYVRLDDHIVGTANAAPPGQVPWWVPIESPGDPHGGALFDPRILSDIARRLRGEAPFTLSPPAPLPKVA